MKKLDYHDYPEPDDRRSGAKVGWYRYHDRAAAELCSKAAKHNARIQESLGFDFGFQSPGSITAVPDAYGGDGMWEVCIP